MSSRASDLRKRFRAQRRLYRDSACPEIGLADIVIRSDGTVAYCPEYSLWIEWPEFKNAYNAIAFGNAAFGMEFNLHVTLTWSCLGLYVDHDVAEAFVDWTAGYRKWCDRNGLSFGFIYAHENSRERGLHTHFLSGIPKVYREDFERWSRRSVTTISGSAPAENACVPQHRPDSQPYMQWRWFQYLMKGADYDTVMKGPDRYRRDRYLLGDLLYRRHAPGGPVRCRKRVGVSRNLDHAARKQAGFLSLLDRGIFDRGQIYTDRYLREYREWVVSEATARALSNLSVL